MGNLIVKDNAFIEASYQMSTGQQRLIFLAILEARKMGDNIEQVLNKTITIEATSYAHHFGVERQVAYEVLKEACVDLYTMEFTYDTRLPNNHVKTTRSRFVQHIEYVDGTGTVGLVFSNEVVSLILGLEKRFTKYEIKEVKGLQSRYAIRLYEMLIKWRSVGKTDVISLEDLRSRFGIEVHEYVRMHHFKQRVLDLAITQINEHTDIVASYEQHKKGRVITGFSFRFEFKQLPITDSGFVEMTANQRYAFSQKLARLPALAHLATGQSGRDYNVFAEQISGDLKDPIKQALYIPFLAQLDFNFNK